MDQPCSTIFLLLVTGALISNTLGREELKVHLEPKYIKAYEGDSVTINCFFQPGVKYFAVRWYYSQTPNSGCGSDRIPKEQRFYTERNDTWATLNINSIVTNDSGWYFCKVTQDIPFFAQKCSNGIQVLVGGLISAHEEEELNVHLEPKYAEVCEGDSVTINCTFQPSGKYKVRWHYRQNIFDCNCVTDRIPEEQHCYKENNDTWETLNINSIATNDSGWYFCKVTRDIPVLKEKCSNAIQVLVTNTCRITACINPKDKL